MPPYIVEQNAPRRQAGIALVEDVGAMRMHVTLIPSLAMIVLVCVLISHCAAADGEVKAPWIPDRGDGTFTNPVLYADYSDPDVIRVGDDFYLISSSFNCIPALPILHSKDLVNWTLIGHAVQRLDDRFSAAVQFGNGIWAPSIRYHDGWFWIFVGDPDLGILMTRTKDPAGKWEPVHIVKEGKGLIDTCPLWDEDGKAYLVHAYANSRSGRSNILVVNEMSPDGTKLLGEESIVVDGRNNVHPTIEGPKFYKRNGMYYILAPAGGVTGGWQIAARSKSPLGPYETKRILEQGKTDINGPHQGGLVELASGESWFMHFQDLGAYGRVVHLNPVRWVDDWPLMGVDNDGNGIGEPVRTFKKPNVGKSYPIVVPQTSDDFDSKLLGLQWQWHGNPQPNRLSIDARPGWLRLNAVQNAGGNLAGATNVLLQKFPAPTFQVTTKVEFTSSDPATSAGLIVAGATYTGLLISRGENGLDLQRVTSQTVGRTGAPAGRRGGGIGDSTRATSEQVEASATGLKGPLYLRINVERQASCHFSYSTDGEKFIPLGSPFPARAGGWMGAKVGLVCVGPGGYADFDWFRVEP